LRSGRFDLLFKLPKPDQKARKKIFEIHTKNKPIAKDVDFKRLATETEGKTGADIESICRKTSMLAIKEFIDIGTHKSKESALLTGKDYTDEDLKISRKHFEEAIKLVKEQDSKE